MKQVKSKTHTREHGMFLRFSEGEAPVFADKMQIGPGTRVQKSKMKRQILASGFSDCANRSTTLQTGGVRGSLEVYPAMVYPEFSGFSSLRWQQHVAATKPCVARWLCSSSVGFYDRARRIDVLRRELDEIGLFCLYFKL